MKISMKNSKNSKKGKQRTHAIWPPSTSTPNLYLHVYKNALGLNFSSFIFFSCFNFPCDPP